MRFKCLGNMGARTWWGTGTLKDRNLGFWSGDWLMGVNGPREGKYDLKLVRWCGNHGHSCTRTVDLFWSFEYHRAGFPTLSGNALRQAWERERHERLEAATGRREGRELFVVGFNDIRAVSSLNRKELCQYLDQYHPDPGPWKEYYQERKAYFLTERTRFKRVLEFWRGCDPLVRKAFLRCARYSNRRSETHPDYLVVFHNSDGRMVDYGFVEVKGPRESLRPSQREFFSELVRRAGQKVWLACFNMQGTSINFARFTSKGELESVCLPSDQSPRFAAKKVSAATLAS